MFFNCGAIVVLLAALDCARAYECDAGKHNATERAPCAGWPPAADSAHNWSTCELVLGCCWQLTDPADNASLVCYAPNHHPAPPAPLADARGAPAPPRRRDRARAAAAGGLKGAAARPRAG